MHKHRSGTAFNPCNCVSTSPEPFFSPKKNEEQSQKDKRPVFPQYPESGVLKIWTQAEDVKEEWGAERGFPGAVGGQEAERGLSGAVGR